jgi:hypothetical protein
MQLLPATNGEEPALFPSASEHDRLLQCRASYLLSRKAIALGQVAHNYSPAADLGTKKHLASTEGPEILSPTEREDWDIVQAKRKSSSKNGRAKNRSVQPKRNGFGCVNLSAD